MTIYDKPVRHLMYDMASDLKITAKQSFCKEDAIEWFKVNYPLINEKTVQCHLIRMSTNAPSRLHFSAIPIEDDLFYKTDGNHFRLFDKNTDPHPIWHERDISEGKKANCTKKNKDCKRQIKHSPKNTEQLKRLENAGFKPAGEWLLKNDCIFPEIHDLGNKRDALYAFIVMEEVKYVGKTSRRLKERLGMYRKPGKSQITNIRNNAHIKEVLSAGKDVLIYALINDDKEYKGFKLSLPAALEDSIIETIQPEWNVRK